jgi:phage FluMu gp28-like protein
MAKKLDRLELAKKLGANFDYQQAVIGCHDKYRTVRKARQIGMTTALGIESLLDAFMQDDYVICIISPTSRQSLRMMRYIKKAFRRFEKLTGSMIPTEKFTSEEIVFHHGSEIHSLPNNPAGIQGIDCNHAIIDEAGLFGQREGEDIIDAVVGSLSAKKGRLTISGKPKGKRGLLWQYWDTSSDRYKEFTHFTVTWKDRARQDKDYEKEVITHKRILSATQFEETYNAEFIDEGVLIFPHDILDASIALWKTNGFVVMPFEGNPESGRTYVGVDFGRKRDLTEIHVLKQEGKILRTLMMKSLVKMNFEDQKDVIDRMMTRVRPVRMVIDERGLGLALLDYFQKKYGESRVQPMKMSEQRSKERLILQCRNCITDLQLALPPNDELHEQMHSFQKEYTDHGNVRYFGKVDETDFMDDKVIALVAAVEAAQSKPFGFTIM